jgi:adenosylcobinamide-GDP ribazoletransferase
MISRLMQVIASAIADLVAALVFYTSVPVPYPATWRSLEFTGVARLAPLVGCLLGAGLAVIDIGLAALGMPVLTRSAVVVVAWIGLTGGLHLDGAMDTADGLAVADPERRLAVMADSVTGAFGAITAIALVLLKVAALSDLSQYRWLALVLAASWGRWAQQVAIASYPYLKPTGKGAFHKQAISSWRDTIPGFLLLALICGLAGWGLSLAAWQGISLVVLGGAIGLALPAWFNHKLGGHTGDTYGAVVEWCEALFLMGWVLMGGIAANC